MTGTDSFRGIVVKLSCWRLGSGGTGCKVLRRYCLENLENEYKLELETRKYDPFWTYLLSIYQLVDSSSNLESYRAVLPKDYEMSLDG